MCHLWSSVANILPERMNKITRPEGVMYDNFKANYQAIYRHEKSHQHLRVRQFLKSQKFTSLNRIEYPLAVLENARLYNPQAKDPNPFFVTECMLRTVYQEVSVYLKEITFQIF